MGERKVEPLQSGEVAEAALLLSQAYSPSPLIVATFGDPSERQRRVVADGLKYKLAKMPGEAYTAKEDGEIVGVMRMVEWPDCQRSLLHGLFLVPALLLLRGKAVRMRKWQSIWGEHDPKEPHWHLDTMGVLPERQGQGIGSMLLAHFCQRVDGLRQAAYLETDKSRNVRLYERFGFTVVGEAPVLSVPNWFMWRAPRSG